MSEIKKLVKDFIMREYLPGENPDELTDSTPLIGSGILDSLSTLKLVAFLEESSGIKIAPPRSGEDNLGTINDIERFVQSKL